MAHGKGQICHVVSLEANWTACRGQMHEMNFRECKFSLKSHLQTKTKTKMKKKPRRVIPYAILGGFSDCVDVPPNRFNRALSSLPNAMRFHLPKIVCKQTDENQSKIMRNILHLVIIGAQPSNQSITTAQVLHAVRPCPLCITVPKCRYRIYNRLTKEPYYTQRLCKLPVHQLHSLVCAKLGQIVVVIFAIVPTVEWPSLQCS